MRYTSIRKAWLRTRTGHFIGPREVEVDGATATDLETGARLRPTVIHESGPQDVPCAVWADCNHVLVYVTRGCEVTR